MSIGVGDSSEADELEEETNLARDAAETTTQFF